MSEPKGIDKDSTGSYPGPLNEQYYRSRKELVLFSGLLFAWEFIGIELPKDPFPNIHIVIKSPEAIPWVLIILIFYFGHRTLIEWFQSNEKSRERTISRIDLFTTIAIPLVALLVFGIQRIFEVQIVDLFPEKLVGTMLVVALLNLSFGAILGFFIWEFYSGGLRSFSGVDWIFFFVILTFFISSNVYCMFFSRLSGIGIVWYSLSMILGLSIGTILVCMLAYLQKYHKKIAKKLDL